MPFSSLVYMLYIFATLRRFKTFLQCNVKLHQTVTKIIYTSFMCRFSSSFCFVFSSLLLISLISLFLSQYKYETHASHLYIVILRHVGATNGKKLTNTHPPFFQD